MQIHRGSPQPLPILIVTNQDQTGVSGQSLQVRVSPGWGETFQPAKGTIKERGYGWYDYMPTIDEVAKPGKLVLIASTATAGCSTWRDIHDVVATYEPVIDPRTPPVEPPAEPPTPPTPGTNLLAGREWWIAPKSSMTLQSDAKTGTHTATFTGATVGQLSVSDFALTAGRYQLSFDLAANCPVEALIHDHTGDYANLGLREAAGKGANKFVVDLQTCKSARLRLRLDGKPGNTVKISNIVLMRY